MNDYADLEIRLSRWDASSYHVEMRFAESDAKADQAPEGRRVYFKLGELRKTASQPKEHGRLLKEGLFADPALSNYYKNALDRAHGAERQLRLRLLVDRSAPELHDLRWEMLHKPLEAGYLALDQNVVFSRYLYSQDWSRVQLRAKRELRALVVVAGPQDVAKGEKKLEGQVLAPVKVDDELARAQAGLKGIKSIEELASQPAGTEPVTLDNLMGRLQAGCDILYLACHGALLRRDPKDPDSPRDPYLVLEGPDGNAKLVEGEELVKRIRNLYANLRPALIVLASCQSAGTGPGPARTADAQGALAALGPRLAQAGIPAVLAMQGDVEMDTVAEFMPAFFEVLVKEGRVDLAMATARGKVSGKDDWWMPVLFLRLRGGQIWYVPSYAGDVDYAEFMASLIGNIKRKRCHCTPILGPGLFEPLAGSPDEIARRWAGRFPLSPHSLHNLPQVAQYVAGTDGPMTLRIDLLEYLEQEVWERHGEHLPPEAEDMELPDMLAKLGEHLRQREADVYRVLAALPFPIYLNTNPDNLMAEALRAHPGKEPVVEFSRWKTSLEGLPSIYKVEREYRASVKRPLVYHLFGCFEEPTSLVLTEDDFFEYLMWVNRTDNQVPIPTQVTKAWQNTQLLFLGFQMSDWRSRVLLRSILNEKRRKDYGFKAVAVQLQPLEGYLRPGRARRYLEESVFGEKIAAYWGSAEDYVSKLWDEWKVTGGGG